MTNFSYLIGFRNYVWNLPES